MTTRDGVPLDTKLVAMKSGFAMSKKRLSDSGPIHLRPFNIGSGGRLDLSTIYHLPDDSGRKLKDYYLKQGDVLFNNTSSLEVVGKSALVTEDLEVAYSNHVTRIRVVDRTQLSPEWLALCLRQLWVTRYFKNVATPWIGQAGVNPTRLSQVRIPLPSLPEQQQLVDRYATVTTDAGAAAALVQQVVELLKSLDTALLGELVPAVEQMD